MKLISTFKFLMVMLLITIPLSLFAQVDPNEPLGQVDFLMLAITSIGGMKGAGALAIAAGVVQILLAFFRTSFASFAGKYKLLIVYGLSMISGVIALRVSGLDFGGAFFHANTLAALQIFGNQIYKQFLVKTE